MSLPACEHASKYKCYLATCRVTLQVFSVKRFYVQFNSYANCLQTPRCAGSSGRVRHCFVIDGSRCPVSSAGSYRYYVTNTSKMVYCNYFGAKYSYQQTLPWIVPVVLNKLLFPSLELTAFSALLQLYRCN